MSNIANSTARVVADYHAPYPDPISVHAGDRVSIDDTRKTELHGWIWCTDRAGKCGWVPETYVDRQGEFGYLRCDYDAVELTVRVGEALICHKVEAGFVWATNQSGISGWVPLANIVFSSAKHG
jgi:Variant SH3 domain